MKKKNYILGCSRCGFKSCINMQRIWNINFEKIRENTKINNKITGYWVCVSNNCTSR